jgi:hypothetical protein
MLLILTSSDDATATYLANKLRETSIRFVRLNTDKCVEEVSFRYTGNEGPSLSILDEVIEPSDLTALWLRRPREIQISLNVDPGERAHIANEWAEAIEGFLAHVPPELWMNHPTCNVRASHKLEQLTRAAAYGLAVPKTLVTNSHEDLRAFWHSHDGRVIAKPLASGHIERPDGTVTSIYTNRVLATHLEAEPLGACPTLVQQEIAKDYDVRVTIVDDRLTVVSLRHTVNGSQVVDIRRDNMNDVEYALCSMPGDVESALRQLVQSYQLRFAAIDFAVTPAGEWVFFEINPNGQWAWMDIRGATTLWQDFVHAFSA